MKGGAVQTVYAICILPYQTTKVTNHYIKNAGKWLSARWCASMWRAGRALADLDGQLTKVKHTNRGRIGG
jgi:hypothetical protein